MTTLRVTYKGVGMSRARTVLLDVTSETARMLTGRQVDSDGAPSEPSKAYLKANGAVSGEVLHVLDKDCITAREEVVMDLRYGWYVPAGTETEVP